MKEKTTELDIQRENPFTAIQRQAKLLSASDLVPQAYRGGNEKAIANCVIALQIAEQVHANPLMVMQNLHIIQGKPSWSSQFVISALNSCGRFSPIRFKVSGEGMKKTCVAVTKDRETGETLEGPPVSMQMASDEGWLSKAGSKWKTMPDLMLRYRAAKFFGNLYAPDILNGMHTEDEIGDFEPIQADPVPADRPAPSPEKTDF